jgi:hypothetical protein
MPFMHAHVLPQFTWINLVEAEREEEVFGYMRTDVFT